MQNRKWRSFKGGMFKICKKSVKSTDKVCEKYVETMVKTGGNLSEIANA